ncbi:unnamed protein product [Paramecium octaurelia]|uniref:PSI domain-containing protein n=1 Tax=Paramecium octaurelia TaxID=43137 RepID=A0A8S1TWW8_PAROT|nr:unnamed protein product [Paramecium octaurelia]
MIYVKTMRKSLFFFLWYYLNISKTIRVIELNLPMKGVEQLKADIDLYDGITGQVFDLYCWRNSQINININHVTTSITECECTQLLSKTDCTKRTSLGCSWDETKNTCSKGTVTPPVTTTYASYCQSFTQADCVKTFGCLWNTDKCTHFTGCTAFSKTIDDDCKAISNRCITDGVHCVEIGECKSYLKQVSCVVNSDKKDCFWKDNACIDATLCEQYPKTLTTDEQCRAKNIKCTVSKTGSGCQDSATSCAQQDGELQCKFGDQVGKQKCYWTGTACVNRTCDQAPTSYTRHDQCYTDYDTSCTTNGAGCRSITTCSDAKVQEGCKINSSNQQCIWVEGACKDYKCDSAPPSKNTNILCNAFIPGCVTKKDGGCKDNGACSSLDVIACEKDSKNQPCVVNGTSCKDKTCDNAPTTNTTHEACTLYLPTCTVNATLKGCRTRQCDNAPTTLNSLTECSNYLSGCIPKKAGGCQTLTTCDRIDVQDVCLKDSTQKDCVWDKDLSKCLDKTCANAPADSKTSHEKCNGYLPSCTVNSQKNACIDMICENIVESLDCKVDKNNQKCKYKSTCYKQECRLASQTITTYSGCQQHMPSCTLDNSSKGCMPIPPSCSAIKTPEGCVSNSLGGDCAWAGSKCQDKSCATAPSTTTDNTACGSYKSGCLVNNTANGCIDPTTFACTSRQIEDNCYSSVGFKCVYSPSKKCQARSCDTAADTTITSPSTGGYLTTFSNSNCDNYLTDCVLNNSGNGCRTKASACADYNEKNCTEKTAAGKSCYLNSDNTCVDLVCEKIKLTSHTACEAVSGMNKTCTVAKGSSPTACMTKLDSCGQYEQNQCKSTKSGKNCIWDKSACREATCSDATDDASYNTHKECNDYVSTCTVIERVDNKGCIPKKANCSEYTSQAQCVQNSAGNSCYWNGNSTCVTLSTLTCAQIVLTTYSDANCEGVKYSCKANSATACQNKVCTDYKKTNGLTTGTTAVTTDDHCKDLDPDCTIDNATVTKACMTRPATCTGTDTTVCTFSKAGECLFENGACILKSTCSLKTGTNLTYQQCQTYNSACSVNLAGTACVYQLATCDKYTTLAHCRKSAAGLCKIDTNCKAVDATLDCTKIVNTGSIVLSYEICQDFSSSCSVNANGSACLEKKACASYTAASGADCVKGTDATCFWQTSGTASCIPILTASTDCVKVVDAGNALTEDKCSSYNSSCSAKTDKSACFEKKAACSNYSDTNSCIKTSGGAKCYWNTSGTAACIEISTASTDCVKVVDAGNALTDDICSSYNQSCYALSDKSACFEKKAACSNYSDTNSCIKTSGGAKCYWNTSGTAACIEISTASTDCVKVVDAGNALTDDICSSYNQSCYALSDKSACFEKKAACSNYSDTNSCIKTSGGAKCYWNTSGTAACIEISTASTDCVKVVDAGNALTDDICSSYNQSCYALSDKSACFEKKAACSNYSDTNSCIKTSGGAKCYWNTSGTAACIEISTASTDCVKVVDAGNALTDDICSSYNQSCYALSDKSACFEKKAACSNYSDTNSCIKTSGGAKCYWNTSGTAACIEISTASTDCVKVVDAGNALTDDICSSYNQSCYALSDKSACFEKKAACSNYSDTNSCIKTSGGAKCYWNTSGTAACIEISTASTDCVKVVDAGNALTDDICSSYNQSCYALSDKSACFEKKAACSNYSDTNSCIKTSGGAKCYWNTSGTAACIEISTASTDCVKVVDAGNALTDDICSSYNQSCYALSDKSACFEKKAACSNYSDTNSCIKTSGGAKCYWNTSGTAACIEISTASTDCVKVVDAGNALTDDICSSYNQSCYALSDKSACFEKKAACSNYSDTNSCIKTSGGAKCYWNTSGTAACIEISTASTDCVKVVDAGNALTDDICSSYNQSCYALSDKSACFEKKAACSEYSDTKSCIKTSGGAKCYWYTPPGGTASCIQISTASTDCPKLLKTQLAGVATSDTICKQYNASCVQNGDATSCVEVKTKCSDYTGSSTNCVSTSGGVKCYWNTSGTPGCIQITATDCAKVTGSSLTYDICQSYNTNCSVNIAGTACEAKSCTNKPTPWSHTSCSTYLSTCTANKVTSADACKVAPTKCSDVTVQADCIGSVTDAECEWVAGSDGGQCVKKTCYTKSYSSVLTHSNCSTYLSSCTVAKVGGCIPKAACNTYLSSEQCTNVGSCFWNGKKALTCVDLSCDKIEDSYNTHTLCSTITGLKCTVKSTGVGCQNRQTACSSYNDKNCYLNSAEWPCVMVTQDDGSSKCMEKACTTAGSSYTDHNGCYDYYKAIAGTKKADHCTVAMVTSADGTPSPSGCQKVGNCTDYSQAQCYVDSEGRTCVWDDTTKCRIKTCDTAPDTESYDSDDECKLYLDDGTCTVASDDMGCVVRPDKCEGMTKKQCVKDKAGNDCEYLDGACYTKSCSTAPADVTTKDGCASYFNGCTLDESSKCKLEICEDFIFTTDDECQKAKAGCTTNGTKCVLRTSCQAVTNKAGCVQDESQGKCQWLTTSNTCVLRTCTTAPVSTDYDTEAECIAYKEECTTKLGGGCVVKSTCSAATAESACNFVAGQPNNKCTWENNKCRDQGCQDFSFATHAECKAATNKIKCTAGQNGKCTTQSTCEAATVRAACIEGLYNGGYQPCLWIPEANSGSGGCFQYSSCKSLNWTDHTECQKISSQCTTDGSSCLATTLCTETNTKGCKIGYDGPCIKTVPAIDSNDSAICKAYTSCTDAFYKTHKDCQEASTKCTTNGVTSCAPLAACSTYGIQEACVINNVGPVVEQSTNLITSTGQCTWENNTCRDQVCKDLKGITHSQCYGLLKGCTSDGTNCLAISTCASYTTQVTCTTANGSDGPSGKCLWDPTANNKAGACRVYQCSDITGGISTTVCQAALSTCVSNGTICIDQANCSSASYQNKISCNSLGKDGFCVFTKSTATGATENQGTCALMTSCTQAKSDPKACANAKEKCSYTPESKSGTTTIPSKCDPHTCASNKQTNGNCSNFFSWDSKSQQICVVDGADCKEKDPATFTQDQCYVNSGYTYTWSTTTNKCGVCTAVQPNNNNTTDPNTTTPNNTDTSGYILGFTTIILGYLVF